MSLIDPDGMFSGDRMAMLSDQARLYWPYFWCASNTLGRIELNYRKVVGKAFHTFKTPPTEQAFWGFLREYRDCYLLFIYKAEGQVWGQWDTSERWLPEYKTRQDKRTPQPPPKDFEKWRGLYILAKEALHADNSNADHLLTKVLDECEKFSKLLAHSEIVPTDKEEELEEELEEETKPPNPPGGGPVELPARKQAEPDLLPDLGLQVTKPSRPARKARSEKRTIAQLEIALGLSRLGWWVDFWQVYPCHEDKRGAMDAFERQVKTLDQWARVRAGAARYRQKADADPELRLKYGQGWINGERWEDDDEASRARASPLISPSKNDRAVQILMENLAIEGKL